jgi:hypothetical protein
MAQGAAFAELPLLDRFETDITSSLRTGDRVRVVPEKGEVWIIARGDHPA